MKFEIVKFNERLANATSGVTRGRPDLWIKLSSKDGLLKALRFASTCQGHIGIREEGQKDILFPYIDYATALAAVKATVASGVRDDNVLIRIARNTIPYYP